MNVYFCLTCNVCSVSPQTKLLKATKVIKLMYVYIQLIVIYTILFKHISNSKTSRQKMSKNIFCKKIIHTKSNDQRTTYHRCRKER